MVAAITSTIRRLFRAAGYDVARLMPQRVAPRVDFRLTDLLDYHRTTEPIPGMVTLGTAELLYMLCVTQELEGDVLEIGSWQGKSTSYLGKAVRDSSNGHVFAVDHFKGNVGRESLYATGDGLEHLHAQIQRNISALGLDDVVTIIPHASAEARQQVEGKKIRFLFIDGDHTEQGVTTDVELFCPLVVQGGIVVFDDFDSTFPGVVSAATRWVEARRPRSVFVRDNALVCKL